MSTIVSGMTQNRTPETLVDRTREDTTVYPIYTGRRSDRFLCVTMPAGSLTTSIVPIAQNRNPIFSP
jgi:hypothetical protein